LIEKTQETARCSKPRAVYAQAIHPQRDPLPVTKVALYLSDKGVSAAKRGAGARVAWARIRFNHGQIDHAEICDFAKERQATEDQSRRALRTRELVRQGVVRLAQYRSRGLTDDLESKLYGQDSVTLEFLENHDFLMDVTVGAIDPVIRCDIDVVEELGQELMGSAVTLYSLALLHELCHICGFDEDHALERTVTLYEAFNDKEKEQLHEVLSHPNIDSNKVFLHFLEESSNKPEKEKTRLISWLRARTLVEPPYNESKVREVIAERMDLGTLRSRIYEEINRSYAETLDAANASRIADWCLENGMRHVGGRFSRALYLDGLLLAGSQVLASECLSPSIRDLEALTRESSPRFQVEALHEWGLSVGYLEAEVQRISDLIARPRVSRAEVERATSGLKAVMRDFGAVVLEKLDAIQAEESAKIAAERSASGGASETWNKILHDRHEVQTRSTEISSAISQAESALAAAPKHDAVFTVFFQRISPTGAINIGLLNELLDPFFGGDEEVHSLINESGRNVYVTPNIGAWLRKCDDWVEALPAYSRYQIIPRENGGYDVRVWVQRSILEEMYRHHAEDWALNIEEVMNLEHIALARELLLDKLGLGDAMERIASDENADREEAARRIIKEKGLDRETACLSALVEETYSRLPSEVAKLRQDRELSRAQALRMVIQENRSQDNLADQVLKAWLREERPMLHVLEEAIDLHGLKTRVESLLKLATKRRRRIPSVHVLTTLGPGETETNVQNWLEESMALFNVSRAYNLEEEVESRIDRHRKRIGAIGARLIEELDLKGDLLRTMQEEGLRPDREDDTRQGILKLVASYPEVSTEVAKLALLIDYEERIQGRQREPKNVDEPKYVTEYLGAHPEIESQAIDRVIENNRLGEAVKTRVRQLGEEVSEAKKKIVVENLIYNSEKRSTERSEARQRVLESLNLEKEVKSYVRERLNRTLATILARRQIIREHDLTMELDNPRFRYDATGPYKKFNLLYTPSRVDLGAEEVRSVRDLPKWVGGLDQEAAKAGKSLYGLYNRAGVTTLGSPRLVEFLKVGENAFSRGAVFYVSLAAGVNVDVLGIGDFEFFRDQWNMRGDRIVLPTGETYGGFCVPKEFSLLYATIIGAVSKEMSDDILAAFGVPEETRPQVLSDLRKVLRMQLDCHDTLEWEERAIKYLSERYRDYLTATGRPLTPSRMPQLARTLERAGILAVSDEDRRRLDQELAYWVNKKFQGLEEINRIGPFRKVNLIRQLAEEARQRNPSIPPENKLVGVMSASYKEGQRKNGRDIPITDVRFGAGPRKLEIYAGTADPHLLEDIDPEGREILRRMFRGFRSVADIRMVGTCTASDILNYVPDSRLDQVKESVYRRVLEYGLDERIIRTNCIVYGGDLERWAGISDRPPAQRQPLIDEIGKKIHLVALDQRGVYRTYEEAVQGVDFIDLGIPDPELLDLVDNLPKLLYLMRKGRPNSGLIFADGTSGARRRTFSYRYASSKRKVKELFASDDNAVYGALGLGRDTVEQWRREMMRDRQRAKSLFDDLVDGRYGETLKTYQEIVDRINSEELDEEAIKEEIAARNLGVPWRDYRYVSSALGKIRRGLRLHQLDFGTWLVLGGSYLLNGKMSQEEILEAREKFERAIAGAPKTGVEEVKPFEKKDVDYMVEAFLKPIYVPPIEEEYREIQTGLAGSLKAVEEKVSRLERREERRKIARHALAIQERSRAYTSTKELIGQRTTELGFEAMYHRAKTTLQDPTGSISEEDFGRFLAWTMGAFEDLVNRMVPEDSPLKTKMELAVKDCLNGRDIYSKAYENLATQTAKLAELLKEDRNSLEMISMALELLDISLIVEMTREIEDPADMVIQLARFYDTTINSHIFDYFPYHYDSERGVGFEGYTREQKFDLAERRHRWLYTYARHLMVTKTELRDRDPEYQHVWLGDADEGIAPLGVNLSDRAERFWFSYARLRDFAVLDHEGYPLPEIFLDLDPAVIKDEERVNVAIVYPHGNTTVPVALHHGARLSQDGINLMLAALPAIAKDPSSGRDLLIVNDGFMYLSREDYREALLKSRVEGQVAEGKASRIDGGVLVAVKFSRPVIIHGVFFHFTHPLRPQIEDAGAPLIQPLVWEAATHLKCLLPDMLKRSRVGTPDQVNWYAKETDNLSEGDAKRRIEATLLDFSRRHPTIIVKPEKESGGRNARILEVRREGSPIPENLAELRDLVYDISKSDNVVIQEVIPSHVRRLYTKEFQQDLVDRFARMGIPVLLDRRPLTPLFSYFRQILVLCKNGYEISHNITVVSTRGVANVGQGGLLYEYTDDIIDPKYRDDLRRELTEASFRSINAQREYIRKHPEKIIDEYMTVHPEFAGKIRFERKEDLTGFANTDIPYEMADYMPVLQVDENNCLVRIYDEDTGRFQSLYDEQGKPTDVQVYDIEGRPIERVDSEGKPKPIRMFDDLGRRIPLLNGKGKRISTLVVYKIESNPGAGLWRPHDDQLPTNRKGEGVMKIFRCLGQRAKIYREKIQQLAAEPLVRRQSAGLVHPTYLSAIAETYRPVPPTESHLERPSKSAPRLKKALRKAREELGKDGK